MPSHSPGAIGTHQLLWDARLARAKLWLGGFFLLKAKENAELPFPDDWSTRARGRLGHPASIEA